MAPPPSAPTEPAAPNPDDYFDDPTSFFAAFLCIRIGRELVPFKPWERQAELARAIAEHRRVACRSGHKLGKSLLAAALAIWWACTRSSAVVLVTGPTGRQVKKAIWKEIRKFWRNSEALRAIMPEPALNPETGVRWDDGRELFGFSAENADAVSGPGGPEVFVVIDEASGVPRDVWEALQGVRAGGGKVFAIANPTQTTGWFFDAYHDKREGWDLHHLSVLDSPNFIERREVLPGLAGCDYEEEVRIDYGPDSPAYAARVLGNFPSQVANAVIGFGLVERAREAWDEDEEADGATVDLGVDVARYGDDFSAIAARIGYKLFTPAWFERKEARDDGKAVKAIVNGYGAVEVAGLVAQCLGVLPRGENGHTRRVRVKVDVTGEWGRPVVEMLRAWQQMSPPQLDPSVEIYEINFAASSSDSDKYPVVRDELHFGARPWFKEGGALYPDGKLEAELMAATYAPDAKGRNKVESKRDIKKRLGRSPDRADAALLAIYEPPPAPDMTVVGFSIDRRF